MNIIINNLIIYKESWITYILAFLLSVGMSKIYLELYKKINVKSNIVEAVFHLTNYLLIALPIVYVIGLRDITVGYDTYNYFSSYNMFHYDFISPQDFFADALEPGFFILRWSMFHMTDGSLVGAVMPMTLLTVMCMTHAFRIWGKKEDLPLGLFLFYCVFGLNMCDQARQLLAASILSIAIYYLYNQRIKGYTLLVLVAASFHNSALLALFFIPWMGLKRKNFLQKVIYYVAFILLVFLISKSQLITHYSVYLNAKSYETFGLAWVMDILPFIIPMFYIKSRDEICKDIRKITWFMVPFRLAGYLSYFIMRLSYYPAILTLPVMISDLSELDDHKRRQKKFVLILIFSTYFMMEYLYLLHHKVVPYERLNSMR